MAAAAEREVGTRFPRSASMPDGTDSGTGSVELNLYGLAGPPSSAGSRVSRSILLGLVAGLDLRHPGVKLPGYGRIGIDAPVGDRAGALGVSPASLRRRVPRRVIRARGDLSAAGAWQVGRASPRIPMRDIAASARQDPRFPPCVAAHSTRCRSMGRLSLQPDLLPLPRERRTEPDRRDGDGRRRAGARIPRKARRRHARHHRRRARAQRQFPHRWSVQARASVASK